MTKLIYTPPDNIARRDCTYRYAFLGGSIEMGVAEDWQSDMCKFFNKNGWGVFNPRRPDWDSSWTQEFINPQFNQQVTWELNGLEKADIVVMVFIPNTKSPISLLELGLLAKSSKIYVICPKGFWRSGNVEVICNIYDIPLFDSIEDFKQFFLANKDSLNQAS